MIYNQESGRALNEEEVSRLKFHFNLEDLSNMRYLSEDGYDIQNHNDPLCQKFKCATKAIKYVYFSTNNTIDVEKTNYVDSLEDNTLINSVCMNSEYYCKDYHKLIATYNCIGFSFGISLWIPNYLMETCYNKTDCKKSLKSFIKRMKKDIDPKDVADFDKILHKEMKILDTLPETPSNNTIAFIMKNGELTHASRYITSVNELAINNWVSKIGGDILISHEINPIIESYGGDMVYYIGLVENNHSEL